MKKLILLLIPLLMLSSCKKEIDTTSDNSIETFETYLDDNNEINTGVFTVKLNGASASSSYTGNYDLTVSFTVKNISTSTKTIQFKNDTVVRESTGASYSVGSNLYDRKLTLDSEIEGGVVFHATIPTSLSEKYDFSVDFSNVHYKLHLYDKPDELREDVVVTYKIGNSVVNTQTCKQGRPIGTLYTYEERTHQYHASRWYDSDNQQYTAATIIDKDVTLTGYQERNLNVTTTSTDAYSFVNGINYVPSDGIIVVSEQYNNKDVCLSNYAFSSNSSVEKIYLPNTLRRIYSNNFTGCSNLRIIFYAGTQDEWEAVPKTTSIPSSVLVVYNTSFIY